MTRQITRQPTQETKDKQRLAARPDLFAWILANAGSGKTTVLVRRILHLLLTGVEPPQILCLTYTEAAAANMKNRLLKALSGWAVMPEETLAQSLREIVEDTVSRKMLARARELFAIALQSPGGLKIGTIHAFCTRILQVAPIEANVPTRFEVLDEASAGILLAEALEDVLMATDADLELAASVSLVGQEFGTQSRIMELVRSALGRRDLMLDAEGAPVPIDSYRSRVAQALEIDVEEVADPYHRSFLERVPDAATLGNWQRFLSGKTKDKDVAVREGLAKILATHDPAANFSHWADILLTKDGNPKQDQNYLIKETAQAAPEIRATLIALAPFAAETLERVKAIAIRDRSTAIQHVVGRVLAAYAARKLQRRRLDFADLISETKSLVKRVEASWLLYKLDAEIEHLLVDEAQDTNFDQWDILQELTREFVAGFGTRPVGQRPRTVFAVGDQKQSIYSFQGANPQAFEESRRHYRGRTDEAGLSFEEIQLNQSFRSTRDVMTLVDAVFQTPDRWRGLSHEAGVAPQKHISARGDDLGCVDLWPLEPKVEPLARKAWDAAPEQGGRPVTILAGRIARMLAGWIGRGQDDLGRPFSPGDVLILLRGRSELYREIIRALLMEQVPVAGMDRLDLMQHLAVQDMVVIGEALLLPQDDLAVATCLKTPVFGLDDDDLIRLTQERSSGLLPALIDCDEPRLCDIGKRITQFMQKARTQGPFAFYADLLGPGGGYRAMVGRLGSEAGDALNAWLSAALAYDRRQGPSLAGFLAEMRLSQSEVKRDLAEAHGEVRVMTVHGAKGLEAPIVILPDAGRFRTRSSGLRLLPVSEAGQTKLLPIWVRTTDQDVALTREVVQAEKARAEEEHNRLLYVALTRAEDRLIVAGLDEKGLGQSSWYRRVEAGVEELADHFKPLPMPDGSGTLRRMSMGKLSEQKVAAAIAATGSDALADESWLQRPARREFHPEPPLTPSTVIASADEPALAGTATLQTEPGAFGPRERGQLVHLLLQHLHQVVPEERMAAGQRLARQVAPQLSASFTAQLVQDAVVLMAHPEVAPLFGAQGISEVALAGRIRLASGEMREADGRIDRLLVLPGELIFADFKTTPAIPSGPEAVPDSVLRQMAVYHGLLEQAFPGRLIRAQLIYTAGPAIIRLEPGRLAEAKALIGGRSNLRDALAGQA